MNQSLNAKSCPQKHALFLPSTLEALKHLFGFGLLSPFIPRLLKSGSCPISGRDSRKVEGLRRDFVAADAVEKADEGGGFFSEANLGYL